MSSGERMSSTLARGECRKFTPNIFNKTKCTNCFHQKEDHTAEALECNRAARKVSKCGYMFVAPGWDFSNPVNRTKRWQRRWFVLYDDGELSYSLDEHPDTVPQASIDMNKVVEVTDADEITGNPYSLAITAPDGVHFVKGTCREEAKWWKDVLSVLPRNKGRHKRNATFPGSQTSSTLQPASLSCRSSPDSRSMFKRGLTDSGVLIQTATSKWLNVEDEIYPTRDITISVESSKQTSTAGNKTDDSSSDSQSEVEKSHISLQPASSFSPPTRDKVTTDGRIKMRRSLTREKRNISVDQKIYGEKKSDDCYEDGMSSLTNSRVLNQDIQNMIIDSVPSRNDVARRLIFESEKSKREEKLKDIADSLTKPRPRRHSQKDLIRSLERRSLNLIKPTRDGECSDEDKTPEANSPDMNPEKNDIIRGDPDGCGLDLNLHRYSPSSELRVDLPAEDLLNIKKGWLLKQGSGQEWTKHWFVLRGVALMYYRDPTAEDKGILDGVMDLSSVNNVTEVQVQRNYGFQAVCWDDKRYILSAVTAGIRSNWMAAIRKAAGLIEAFTPPSLNHNEKLERDTERCRIETKGPQYFEPNHSSSRSPYSQTGSQKQGSNHLPIAQYEGSPNLSASVSRSPSCQFVERYLRKSTSGHFPERDGVKRSTSAQSLLPEFYKVQSKEDFRVMKSKEKDGWNKGPTPLPPSPPLNRTPISKVKERAKTQTTRSRVYNKRSKSSPPSSRENTLEGSRVEEGVCEEKREEPIKRSTILDKVDRHVKEIDELKGQLSLALCERSTAEKELSRLRQRKSEANHQVEELLRSLKVAEDELKSKTQELENFESLKQRYSALVQEHEGMLKSWRESAINDGWREMYQRLKEEYGNDKESWEIKLADVTSMLHVATERCEMLAGDLASSEATVEALKMELTNLSERLMRGLEENEGLYGRMRELEGRCLSSSRERGRSVDSLSDLTNIDLDIDLDNLDKERVIEEYEELKGRFEKAIQEIRAMKKELRESHANYDDLELTVINLRQDSKRREENGKAQAALMASRIEDLTLKLSASEKQSRLLKQKMTKVESREKRRSLSLKGKESFSIGKETEDKLAELEAKVNALESGTPTSSIVIKPDAPPPDKEHQANSKRSRLRRKSLESAAGTEPMKILLRMFSLERRITKAGKGVTGDRQNNETSTGERESNEGEETLSRVAAILRECRSILSSPKTSSQTLTLLSDCISRAEDILARPVLTSADPCLEDSPLASSYEDYVVHKLENLLRAKVKELWEKRQQILARNELNDEARLKLTAEKLAYESVLIRKIREMVEESGVEGRHWKDTCHASEIQEVIALIELVLRKIRGESANATGNGLDGLAITEAETLYLEGDVTGNCNANTIKVLLQDTESTVNWDELLTRQRTLTELVDAYKFRKYQQIAGSLAFETLFFPEDYEKTKKLTEMDEDKRLREAWSFAQEALNKELAQVEISHLAMRCLVINENGKGKEQDGRLTFIAEKYKRQEDYLRRVEESLSEVIDRTLGEITNEYDKTLEKMKGENVVRSAENLKEEGKKCKKAMEDLFSVLAQVTIINARIASLTNDVSRQKSQSDASGRPVVRGVCLKSHLADFDMQTRFIYLYQKFSLECLQSTERMEFYSKDAAAVGKALNGAAESVKRLREIFRLAEPATPIATDDTLESEGTTVRDKCHRLATELENVVNCVRGDSFCRRCNFLTEALQNVESRYDEEISLLKLRHDKELKDLRGELESQRNSLVCQHEQEQAELIERTRLLERRLGTLDAEYSQQMNNLRTAYHRTISADLTAGKDESTEDSIRQRYQAEIEQLRTLCEKGLSAVDNSHRRIIAELEEKHRQELAAAAAEKEQALAEETQATLAALDAMRKAHETEVQKEINKFKAEFLKKMQSSHDIGALHKEHEVEMEEIKKEILSLSEKYSVKCVESASLEEQLSHVSKQLCQAQEHIMQLDARNKKLRAHLVSGTVDLDDFDRYLNDDATDRLSMYPSQKSAPLVGGRSTGKLIESLKK